MTEYAGYIAVNPVDWSKVAKEATDDFMSIMDERKKQKEELDALAVEGQKQIGEWAKSADSDMNNVLMAGTQSARSYIQAQNDLLKRGMITPEEYKRNIANVQTNFSLISKGVGSFGDNIAKHEQMVMDGTASDQQIANMKRYAKYTTMKNASIEIGPNGDVFMKDTQSKDGEIIPIGALVDPSNFFSKRIELTKYSTDFVKTLADEKYYDGEKDVYISRKKIDPKLLDEAVYGLVGEDDNKYANVLTTNNMGYTFDEEEAKRTDKKLIKQKLGPDGNYHAILEEEDREKVRIALKESILGRIKEVETGFGTGQRLGQGERRLDIQEQRLIDKMNADEAKRFAKMNKEERRKELKRLARKEKLDDRVAQINMVLGPNGLDSSEGTSILQKIKVPDYKGKGVVQEIRKLGENEYAFIYPDISYRATKEQAIAIINNAYNSTQGYDDIPATDIKNMAVKTDKGSIDTSTYNK